MITTLDIIERLPYELQARLEADTFFEDIPVVVAEAGNVKREMEKRQAVITEKTGKRGVAVVVLPVVGDDEVSNLQFGPMRFYPAFQVVENVELNNDARGTGKSGRKVARRIRDVIKCWGAVGLVKSMEADRPCIEPVTLAAELGDQIRAYQVNFRCLEVTTEAISQVALPQFTVAGGLAIATATDGATIYYTTDDSYPWSGNPAAKVYSEPLSVPEAGVTVRACAYKAGMVASWVNRVTALAVAE